MLQEGNWLFTSCRHSTRKLRLSARPLRLVQCFAQCRFQSNVRQYQALCCLLTKRKPVLVGRALRLAWLGIIGVNGGLLLQQSGCSAEKRLLVPSDVEAPVDLNRPIRGILERARGIKPFKEAAN
jgi:hypothetical protein